MIAAPQGDESAKESRNAEPLYSKRVYVASSYPLSENNNTLCYFYLTQIRETAILFVR
jgi:hypothetical protein